MSNKAYDTERLLIISNNVLSQVNNNGKTILSFVDGLKKTNVKQLYFSNETPEISDYEYFSITNKDVIKGRFCISKRGGVQNESIKMEFDDNKQNQLSIKKNNITKLIRELLWNNAWKSPQLIEWLDSFKPTAVFFVAGDAVFAYAIYEFIVSRYNAIGSIYITDDYITKRVSEDFFFEMHRKLIVKKLFSALELTKNFFTISTVMQNEYYKMLNRNSNLIVNMTESLLDTSVNTNPNYLIYTGSLYYGRDEVLGEIGKAIQSYNEKNHTCFELHIYSNNQPSKDVLNNIVVEKGSKYCGSLTKTELIIELNSAAFLVFVESFDKEQIEKTRFSLSTKVTEYLSLGKPILAVGPVGIGSIDYLEDVAFSINNKNEIREKLSLFLSEKYNKSEICDKARKKYNVNHEKKIAQRNFYRLIFNHDREG